jgi:hypothetical protein
MKFLNYFERIKAIDHCIQLKSTGTPKELSEKLSISERALYETLNLMKDFGAEIFYNPCIRSYCYENEGQFEVKFGFVHIGNNKNKSEGGGKYFLFIELRRNVKQVHGLMSSFTIGRDVYHA